jgi:hypothetical protein
MRSTFVSAVLATAGMAVAAPSAGAEVPNRVDVERGY